MDKKLTLCNIYRPPQRNECNDVIDSFINELQPVLSKLQNESSHCVFAGDYNIDLLKINERLKIQEYFDIFTTHGFTPNIVLPTRFSHRNASLIDQLFCKMSSADTRNSNVSGILISNLSDHLPYFSSLDICSPRKQTPKYIKCNNNSPESIRQFYANVGSEMSTRSFNSDTK